MKHRESPRAHALLRRLYPSAFMMAGLAVALSGCADNEIRQLEAQPSEEDAVEVAELDSAGSASPEAPRFAPEDTASRTVREAIDQRLAFVGDSIAAAEELVAGDSTLADSLPPPPAPRYNAGEDPDFARRHGWPVNSPLPLPGAILPENRIICYYGNPNSTRMGALGEFPKDEMLQRLMGEVNNWNRADPDHPVKPCLHMVAVVAQAEPGTSGHYRSIMLDSSVQEVHSWAREVDGLLFVDIQVGTDRLENILPRFEWILKEPDVHLGVDPEFMMKTGARPGTRIGTMDAADINYATAELARIVREYDLPPKVLVIHRFTRNMVTNVDRIILRPEVQVVMHMDGWGAPWLKRDSYRDFVVREPVEYTGFKIFYHNDTKNGDPLMLPNDLLRLAPKPLYIQYQ